MTGIMNETYRQALAFCQSSTRENGIDAALRHNGTKVDALLVPPDVGQTYQIAAQAGTLFNSPIGNILRISPRADGCVQRLPHDHATRGREPFYGNAVRTCVDEHCMV